jgi:hypothetical protein
MPMGRLARRPSRRQAMVEERAVAVTTAGIGKPGGRGGGGKARRATRRASGLLHGPGTVCTAWLLRGAEAAAIGDCDYKKASPF